MVTGAPSDDGHLGRLVAPSLPGPVALSWSSGKDSAFSLWALRGEHAVEPRALITTVTEAYERVSMHGVRRALLERQAAAVGLPLVEVSIPPACPDELYQARMEEALASSELRGIEVVAFGDLFLEDVRRYREAQLAAAGKLAVFPLWGRDTRELGGSFIAAGFEAILVCVDPRQLDPMFAGRRYDHALLADLPADVDPCGENGEFHTFVLAGPVFEEPLDCRVGRVVVRDGFAFCDLDPQ
jgi:uncharacterized protein (TIGR00290 family)